jgi:hypothetical protein
MKKTFVKDIEPYSDKWEKEANQIARDFCPTIYPCKKCNHPVANGYCCRYCGSTNPSSDEPDQFQL